MITRVIDVDVLIWVEIGEGVELKLELVLKDVLVSDAEVLPEMVA